MARSGRSRRATTKRRGRRTAATSSKFSPAVTRCGTRRRASVSRHVAFVLGLGLAAGCALKGDVRKVELQVAALKADAARADADRAAQIDSVLKLLAAVQQAVAAQQAYLVQFRGDVRTDLVGVQQQLVTVQELTGQSQQRLSELRARIEERAQQPVPPLDASAARPVQAGSRRRGAGRQEGGADILCQSRRRVSPLGRGQPRPRQAATPGALSVPRAPSRSGGPVPDPAPRGEMPFLDHLEELRWRILKSLLVIVVATLVGWFIVQSVDVIAVLFSFQRSDLAPIITADNYFGFAAQIMIAFGLVTELPLVVVILAALGLVTPQFLAHNRRYALVIAALAAALLTPPDAVSMLLMMVPLVLLYEVSIWCAWVVTRRRARRAQAAARAGVVLLMLCGLGAGRLAAQGVGPPRRTALPPRSDSTARAGAPGTGAPHGQPLDTASARRLGLPTGPTPSHPPGQALVVSPCYLKGYRVTQYVADTLIVAGDSQTIFLRGEAYVDREGTKLESESIRYRESSCQLDAAGDPRLFEQGTVLVGEGMRYDTCIRRGTIHNALTSFQQGGATWYTRGDLAVDSASTRLYR